MQAGRELTTEEIEQLMCSVPEDATYVEVHGPEDLKGNGATHDVNIAHSGDDRLSVAQSVREIVQNFLDQLARSNGHEDAPSFTGVRIFEGTFKTFKVLFFFNEHKKLGEVHTCPETRTVNFINYGPVVEHADQIFGIGKSNKIGVPNQSGQHGEGLKRAIACFLHNGRFSVSIECAVMANGQTEFRRWRMSLNDRGWVIYKETKINPTPMRLPESKFPCDKHRIVVTITGTKMLNFDLFDYLVPRDYIQDQRGPDDVGSIMFEPKMRGVLGVCHFKVMKFDREQMRFGYDLFLPTIPRDRTSVPYEYLIPALANVWSPAIISNKDHALLFYTEVLMKSTHENGDFSCEQKAIKHLNPAAMAVLVELYKESNKGACLPITADAKLELRHGVSRAFQIVPEHAKVVFDTDPSTATDKLLCSDAVALARADNVSALYKTFAENIAPIFQDLVKITIRSSACNSMFHYFHAKDPEELALNEAFVATLSDDELIGEIAFSILPRIFEGRPFQPGSLVSNIRKRHPLILEMPVAVPVAVPEAAAPPARKRDRPQEEAVEHVVDIIISSDDDDDDDDDNQVASDIEIAIPKGANVIIFRKKAKPAQ